MAVGCFIQWWLMLSKYASTEVFVVGCKWVSWNIFHCLCDDEASGIWPVCGWNWCAIATQCTQGAKFSTKKYLLISTNFQGRIIQTIIHPFYRRSRIFELDTNMAKIWRFSRRNSCPQKYSWLHQLHSHMAVAEPGILYSGLDITNCSMLWKLVVLQDT